MKNGLKNFGSRFAFELFLEMNKKALLDGFKEYLKNIQPADIASMIDNGKLPPMEGLDFSVVGDNIKHIEKIKLIRFIEFINEARPDLSKVIQSKGQAGVDYLVKLREHVIKKAKGDDFKPESNMILVTCDSCQKSWPVKKEEVATITVCPFCNTPANETAQSEENNPS